SDSMADHLPFSDEAFVTAVLVAQHAWLVQDAASVESQLGEVTKGFAISKDEILVESFLAAVAIADLNETKQFLARNGFVLAERLLTKESYQQSRLVVASATELAKKIGDEPLVIDAQRFAQTLEQAAKMSATVVRRENLEFASDAERGV